jgi:lactoylglutathione lyase
MFNFNGIDHINMKVRNLEESLVFYNKVFNFKVKEEGFSQMSESKYSIIGISNKAMLCLYEDPKFDNIKSHVGHIGFNINFKENMIKYLKDSNVKINYYHESGISEYPESKSIYIEDPNGYEIELSSKFGGGL